MSDEDWRAAVRTIIRHDKAKEAIALLRPHALCAGPIVVRRATGYMECETCRRQAIASEETSMRAMTETHTQDVLWVSFEPNTNS